MTRAIRWAEIPWPGDDRVHDSRSSNGYDSRFSMMVVLSIPARGVLVRRRFRRSLLAGVMLESSLEGLIRTLVLECVWTCQSGRLRLDYGYPDPGRQLQQQERTIPVQCRIPILNESSDRPV